ncbi:MAG: hypothetical protein ABIH72_01665 [archaeon]
MKTELKKIIEKDKQSKLNFIREEIINPLYEGKISDIEKLEVFLKLIGESVKDGTLEQRIQAFNKFTSDDEAIKSKAREIIESVKPKEPKVIDYQVYCKAMENGYSVEDLKKSYPDTTSRQWGGLKTAYQKKKKKAEEKLEDAPASDDLTFEEFRKLIDQGNPYETIIKNYATDQKVKLKITSFKAKLTQQKKQEQINNDPREPLHYGLYCKLRKEGYSEEEMLKVYKSPKPNSMVGFRRQYKSRELGK